IKKARSAGRPRVTLIQSAARLPTSKGCPLSARQLPRPAPTKAVLGPKRVYGPQTVTLGVLFDGLVRQPSLPAVGAAGSGNETISRSMRLRRELKLRPGVKIAIATHGLSVAIWTRRSKSLA